MLRQSHKPGLTQTPYVAENDLDLPCLHLLSSGVTDVCHYTKFYLMLRIEPRTSSIQALHHRATSPALTNFETGSNCGALVVFELLGSVGALFSLWNNWVFKHTPTSSVLTFKCNQFTHTKMATQFRHIGPWLTNPSKHSVGFLRDQGSVRE